MILTKMSALNLRCPVVICCTVKVVVVYFELMIMSYPIFMQMTIKGMSASVRDD